METETLSMEWDAESLEEIRRTARVFNMTVTEFFKEAAEAVQGGCGGSTRRPSEYSISGHPGTSKVPSEYPLALF